MTCKICNKGELHRFSELDIVNYTFSKFWKRPVTTECAFICDECGNVSYIGVEYNLNPQITKTEVKK